MIEFYLASDQNTSLTACVFRTSRPTVNKWVRRYKEGGWTGLKDLSQRPHHMPTKISPHEEVYTLPHRRPAEVAAVTREIIACLGAGGGYVLSAANNIQADVPPQNILAMVEAVISIA